MFKNEKKTFGFRKASNVTTIGGTEVGTTNVVKGAIIAGATLAVIPFVGGQSVSADEVTAPVAPETTAVATNPNPATNLETPQPAQTEANISANANAGQTSGDTAVTTKITDPALDASVAKAEQTGVDVTTEANKEYTKEADAKADLASQKTAVDKATAEKQANVDAIKQANAKNAQIDKDNADAKAKYEADLAKHNADLLAQQKAQDAYNNGTNISQNVEAKTQSVVGSEYGDTFMKAKTDDKTGAFTLTHDMNDGVNIIGLGNLNGKINSTVVSDGKGGEIITITSVDLYDYNYTNKVANSAVNQNINFHVYDLSGKEIFSVYHDGNTTFAKEINKNVVINKVFNVKAGETTPLTQVLKVDDNWIYNTHGQVFAQLKNTNVLTPVTVTPPPTLKTIPKVPVPEVKNVAVAVHPVAVSQAPKIIKDAVNDSGVSINGKLVPKNSEATFVLDLPTLNAGRPVFKDGEIVVHDALPSDMAHELATIQSLNPTWTFFYDEATNSYSAKPTEVELANINKTDVAYSFKDLTLPVSPQNDNGTYNNTYSLALGGYLVYSNKVTFYTPGSDDPNDPNHGGSTIQPTKQVFDLEGNDINNKPVKAGQQIKYVGKWDLDQYKDIVAGAVAISKGFGFIDNYDETKETIDVKGTTIKSASGKDVTGLTPYVVKNLADAPQAIKDLVIASGVPIGDNDEFVIWVADDKQDFFDTYVVTGDSIFFTMPATIKDDVKTGDSIDNIVYQIDFGNGYAGNVVHNPVENPVEPTGTGSETPTPTPTPQPELPTTGDNNSNQIASLGLSLLMGAMGAVFGFRKKESK